MNLSKLAAAPFLVALLASGCGRGDPVAEIRPVVANGAKAETAAGLPESSAERPSLQPDDTDWPCWRGASGTGIARGSAPVEWSATKNVIWSVAVPGKGHSSPTIWGEQIFLA